MDFTYLEADSIKSFVFGEGKIRIVLYTGEVINMETKYNFHELILVGLRLQLYKCYSILSLCKIAIMKQRKPIRDNFLKVLESNTFTIKQIPLLIKRLTIGVEQLSLHKGTYPKPVGNISNKDCIIYFPNVLSTEDKKEIINRFVELYEFNWPPPIPNHIKNTYGKQGKLRMFRPIYHIDKKKTITNVARRLKVDSANGVARQQVDSATSVARRTSLDSATKVARRPPIARRTIAQKG